MDDEPFTPKLRLGRIYLLMLVSVLAFDLSVLWDDVSRHDAFSWGFVALMTLFFPLAGLWLVPLMLAPSFSTAGIKVFMRQSLPWTVPCRVSRSFPGWFVRVSSPSQRTGLPMSYFLPALPLVREGTAYVQALHRFAPIGHPVLKQFPLSTRRA